MARKDDTNNRDPLRWTIEGIDAESRAIAERAAAAAGVSVGEWLAAIILTETRQTETAANPYVPPDESDPSEAPPIARRRKELPERDLDYTPPPPAEDDAAEDRDDDLPRSAFAGEARDFRQPTRLRWPLIAATAMLLVALIGGGWLVVWLLEEPHPPDDDIVTPTAVHEPAESPPPATAPAAAPASTAPAAPRSTDILADAMPGLTPDQLRTLASLQQSAEAGAAAEQLDLGNLYAEGRLVRQNYERAAHWYREAATQGLDRAQFNLGVLYERGLGVGKDAVQALFWYLTAAERDNPQAQYNLGVAYAEGRGIPQDFTQAIRWFGRAAEQNIPQAHYNLGVIYETGLGVPRNARQALHHYELAAKAGDNGAVAKVREMTAALTAVPGGGAAREAAHAQKSAAQRDTPAPSPAAPAPLTAPSRSMIAAIQRLLAELAYDPGPADGVVGRRTSAAIRQFQEHAGLSVDGRPSDAVLEALVQVAKPVKSTTRKPAVN
ncbi:MAG: SEL1-like repeat protein [Rhodospirillales bacterium]|nr:SEL1-like repeat protein [Rhodospirillales bacterium]